MTPRTPSPRQRGTGPRSHLGTTRSRSFECLRPGEGSDAPEDLSREGGVHLTQAPRAGPASVETLGGQNVSGPTVADRRPPESVVVPRL